MSHNVSTGLTALLCRLCLKPYRPVSLQTKGKSRLSRRDVRRHDKAKCQVTNDIRYSYGVSKSKLGPREKPAALKGHLVTVDQAPRPRSQYFHMSQSSSGLQLHSKNSSCKTGDGAECHILRCHPTQASPTPTTQGAVEGNCPSLYNFVSQRTSILARYQLSSSTLYQCAQQPRVLVITCPESLTASLCVCVPVSLFLSHICALARAQTHTHTHPALPTWPLTLHRTG